MLCQGIALGGIKDIILLGGLNVGGVLRINQRRDSYTVTNAGTSTLFLKVPLKDIYAPIVAVPTKTNRNGVERKITEIV